LMRGRTRSCYAAPMPLLKCTFDTNTLDRVVRPSHKDDVSAVVHEGLKAGGIKGYFSEAVVALDGIGHLDKVDMVGAGRVVSESRATGRYSVELTVGRRWPAKRTDQQFKDGIEAALDLGLRPLLGPRPMGDSLAVPEFVQRGLYETLGVGTDLMARRDRIHAVDTALRSRGIGRQRAIDLGREYNARAGAAGEFYQQGLGRAQNDAERKKVLKAVNEWADGEAVAAHVGYGNDLFCSHDFARNSRGPSALHPDHRAWLTQTFGVEFVTVAQLAERVSSAA
jgi:hypothetical protein